MIGGATVYFIRHGETDWNAEHRLQGQIDIPLNDTGRRQARRNGQVLRDVLAHPGGVDFVASPLERATETMRIVREALDLEPAGYRTDDRLKEVNFGDWEGLRWADLLSRDPRGYEERMAGPFAWRPHNGESYEDLSARARGWLQTVERETVVVSHGGISRVLRGLLYDLVPDDIPNLSVPQDKVLVLRATDMAWL
jgi:broad specificity phosphatase PhoE